MRKVIYYILFVFAFLFVENANAAYLNVSSNVQTVYVGDNFYVTVSANDLMGVYNLVSMNGGIASGGDEYGLTIESGDQYSYSKWYTAKSVGTVDIIAQPVTLYSYSSETIYENTGRVTINVIERPSYPDPIEINRTYSANNYLSGLAVEGYSIIPEFDKEILEYSMEVDYNVEKVNIQVSLEDETATVDGVGEREVEEGKNTFTIKVTAENGNEREYVLNVLVKELNPTKVKIDKKDYSLVKKEDKLPELENYVKTTVKIDNVEVPGLKGKITKYTLVGLKDEKGDISLYIYDAKNKTYTPYNEIKFANVALYYMENNNTKYKKTTIKIKGQEVVAYKKSGLDYYLIYGMNLNTGKVNWYTYDKEEGIEIGREKGRNEKAMEAAERLIKMNLGTVEQIATAVNLPVEQVLEIKEKISVKA